MPSPENSEFVAQDDDFKLFEVVRADAQGRELENPRETQSITTKPARDLLRSPILRIGSCLLHSGSDEMHRI